LQILAEPPLTLANLEFLETRAGDTVRLLHPGKGAARGRLADGWKAAMERIARDEALSVDERISALLPEVELHALFHPGRRFPQALRRRIREQAEWADRMAVDDTTRQAAMSTAGHLLEEAGLSAEARALYLAQIEKSSSPHYFMSSLAGLAREAGDRDEAIGWLRKAHESSRGRATRFQWGAAYLLGLLELAPENEARIRAESLRVLGELVGLDDAFAGRNQVRLERLADGFARWNEAGAHGAAIAAIRETLLPACSTLEGDPPAALEGRERCDSFFRSLGG
jgi:hypothetical protein